VRSDEGLRARVRLAEMAVTEMSEENIAGGLQWLCFLFSWALFAFYAFQFRRQTCGWEGESQI